MLIKDVCHKHPKILTSGATIGEAVQSLLEDEVNGLIVVDDKGHVEGVLSLQDIAAATVPSQFRSNVQMASAMYKLGFFAEMCLQLKEKPVTSLMRTEYISVGLEDNIMAVTADFLKNDLYIVPVLEKGVLVGVITRTEIKKAIAEGMGL